MVGTFILVGMIVAGIGLDIWYRKTIKGAPPEDPAVKPHESQFCIHGRKGDCHECDTMIW